MPGWSARRAVVLVLRPVVDVSRRSARWAVVFGLRRVVRMSGRRAPRAVVLVRRGVLAHVVLLLGPGFGRRVLLMVVRQARRGMLRALARLAGCDVVAMAEGEPGRDVLLTPDRQPRREARAARAARNLALVLVMSECQPVRRSAARGLVFLSACGRRRLGCRSRRRRWSRRSGSRGGRRGGARPTTRARRRLIPATVRLVRGIASRIRRGGGTGHGRAHGNRRRYECRRRRLGRRSRGRGLSLLMVRLLARGGRRDNDFLRRRGRRTGGRSDRRDVRRARVEDHGRAHAEEERDRRHSRSPSDHPESSCSAFVGRHRPFPPLLDGPPSA